MSTCDNYITEETCENDLDCYWGRYDRESPPRCLFKDVDVSLQNENFYSEELQSLYDETTILKYVAMARHIILLVLVLLFSVHKKKQKLKVFVYITVAAVVADFIIFFLLHLSKENKQDLLFREYLDARSRTMELHLLSYFIVVAHAGAVGLLILSTKLKLQMTVAPLPDSPAATPPNSP